MDVKTAFLDGNIDVDVYMEQLEGFIDTKYPEKVCKLRKVFTVCNNQPYVGTKQLIIF